MSTLTFNIEADKIGPNVLDSIKAFFGTKKIAISITEESPHLMSQQDFEDKITTAESADFEYVMSPEQLHEFIQQSIDGSKADGEGFKQIISRKSK